MGGGVGIYLKRALLASSLSALGLVTVSADKAWSGPDIGRRSSFEINERVSVRRVWPLFVDYGRGGGRCRGYTRPMRVRMSRSDGGDLRVGFFESEFFGAGPMWRAGGWMAVVVAALVTGQPMDRWRIAYDISGLTRGPSSSGLMTATVLSIILGHKLLPGVTLTGAINPDGSIGPVGGIYYKLEGARRAGIKKVLVPAGRTEGRTCGGRRVNLRTEGRRLGVEVVEVPDIFVAYRHLTGRSLDRAPPAAGRGLDLPPRAKRTVMAAYNRWLTIYRRRKGRIGANPGAAGRFFSKELKTLVRRMKAGASMAAGYFKRGQYCVAWTMAWHAAVLAEQAVGVGRLAGVYSRGDIGPMIRSLRGMMIGPVFLHRWLDRLKTRPIKNLSDLMAMAEAYMYYNVGLGLSRVSDIFFSSLSRIKDEKQRVEVALSALGLNVFARGFMWVIDDFLRLGLGYPGPPLPPMKTLRAWSRLMRRAAYANLGYIEKAIIDPRAAERRRSAVRAKMTWLKSDMHYLRAWACFQAMAMVRPRVPAGAHRAAATLGGTTGSFALSALVVAKHYSLEAGLGRGGGVTRLDKVGALEIMLRSARANLRRTILQAKAAGCSLVIPVFHSRLADAFSRPDSPLSIRVGSLADYWLGSTFSRLMAIFASSRRLSDPD